MVRTVTKKAKDAIVDAAQGVRTMAGEAFGAATKAAADVVFESTANALEAGRVRLRRATPAMENALGNAARRSVDKRKPGRRKDSRCAKARRETKSGIAEKKRPRQDALQNGAGLASTISATRRGRGHPAHCGALEQEFVSAVSAMTSGSVPEDV